MTTVNIFMYNLSDFFNSDTSRKHCIYTYWGLIAFYSLVHPACLSMTVNTYFPFHWPCHVPSCRQIHCSLTVYLWLDTQVVSHFSFVNSVSVVILDYIMSLGYILIRRQMIADSLEVCCSFVFSASDSAPSHKLTGTRRSHLCYQQWDDLKEMENLLRLLLCFSLPP